jgi:hypothetical protein
VIPSAYIEWYRAVFEDGRRTPPPDEAVAAVVLASAAVNRRTGSDHFDITELLELDTEVLHFFDNFIVTARSTYAAGRKLAETGGDVKLAITPRNRHLIAACLAGRALTLHDLTSNREVKAEIEVEQAMSYEGRLYVKHESSLFQIEFIETSSVTTASLKRVGNVLKNATRLFEGVAIQNLLGAYYASFLSAPGACYQTRMKELDEYQLIDARLSRNVLIVVGTKNGAYDKLVFRFGGDFQRYDVRITRDTQLAEIDFTVLDTGICLHVTENDELEVFAAAAGSTGLKILSDPAIQSDARLFHLGRQALFARGNKLYRFALHS